MQSDKAKQSGSSTDEEAEIVREGSVAQIFTQEEFVERLSSWQLAEAKKRKKWKQ